MFQKYLNFVVKKSKHFNFAKNGKIQSDLNVTIHLVSLENIAESRFIVNWRNIYNNLLYIVGVFKKKLLN